VAEFEGAARLIDRAGAGQVGHAGSRRAGVLRERPVHRQRVGVEGQRAGLEGQRAVDFEVRRLAVAPVPMIGIPKLPAGSVLGMMVRKSAAVGTPALEGHAEEEPQLVLTNQSVLVHPVQSFTVGVAVPVGVCVPFGSASASGCW